MSRNEDEYKEWQERYESLKEEYDEDWSDDEKRDHLENMKLSNEQELWDREEAREEWGDDGNEGHDERTEKLRDRGLLLNNAIAQADGDYEYQTERMQDMDPDLRRELEEENNEIWRYSEQQRGDQHDEEENEQEEETSDMDIESGSDSDSD